MEKGKEKRRKITLKNEEKGMFLGYKISSYKVGTVITILKNQ